MSEGGKWTPGKIFLLVIGILAGLGILCCGGLYLLLGDKIKAAFTFASETKAFAEQLKKDYGKSARFDIKSNDRSEVILAIGVEGDLTPERVTEVQDGAWRRFGEIFGKDGFFPVKHLAVGKPAPGGGNRGGKVIEWGKNTVSVDELVKRTGVPAPPLARFLPSDMDNGSFQVHVNDDGKDEEGDGGGTGGK